MRRIAYVQAYAIGNAADDYGMCHGAVVAGRVRIRSHNGGSGGWIWLVGGLGASVCEDWLAQWPGYGSAPARIAWTGAETGLGAARDSDAGARQETWLRRRAQ